MSPGADTVSADQFCGVALSVANLKPLKDIWICHCAGDWLTASWIGRLQSVIRYGLYFTRVLKFNGVGTLSQFIFVENVNIVITSKYLRVISFVSFVDNLCKRCILNLYTYIMYICNHCIDDISSWLSQDDHMARYYHIMRYI